MPNHKASLTRLPSLPTIAIEVLRIFSDPDAPIQKIANLVQADPAIATKLLKAANSSRFGLPRKVADLRQAITLMGKAKVTPIILSFSLASESIESEEHSANFKRYWLRSFVQATAGEVIGSIYGPGFAAECFTISLLAGIGQLGLLKQGPAEYLQCTERAKSGEATLDEIERDVYGMTHKEISIEMLEQSGLPQRCVDAITATISGKQFVPADEETRRLADVTCAADAFARYLCDTDCGIAMVVLQDRLAMMESSVLTVEKLTAEVRVKIDESSALFNVDPSVLPNPENLLQDALDQLSDFTERMHEGLDNELPVELVAENGRLKQRVEDLIRQTNTDALTGIANRGFFDRRLNELTQQCLRCQWRMGIAVVDIDHFKKVNDTYGHQAGDHILQVVAHALADAVRANETLARYGGEEFAVLMEDIQTDGMQIMGERLRAKIEGLRISFEGQNIPVTISIGIATAIPTSDNFGLQLFTKADSALYVAKHEGRNRICVDNTPTEDFEPTSGLVPGHSLPAKATTPA